MRIRKVLSNALMAASLTVFGCTLRDVQGFDMGNEDSLDGNGGILAGKDLSVNEKECEYQSDGPGFCRFDCGFTDTGRSDENRKYCVIKRKPSSLSMSVTADRAPNVPTESPVLRGCLCRISLGGPNVQVSGREFEAEFDFNLEHAVVDVNGVDGGILDKGRLLMFARKGKFVDEQNTIIDYHGGLIGAKAVKISGTVNLPNGSDQEYIYVSLSSDRANSCPSGRSYCSSELNWTLKNLKIANLRVP